MPGGFHEFSAKPSDAAPPSRTREIGRPRDQWLNLEKPKPLDGPFFLFSFACYPLNLNEVRCPFSGYLVISHILWFYRVLNNVLDGVVHWSPEFGNSGAKKGRLLDSAKKWRLEFTRERDRLLPCYVRPLPRSSIDGWLMAC